jgi:DNA-directed RNA polymerase subunit M/transcription elongation factor TFIIS
MLTDFIPKNPKFNCEKCNYITNNKKDFNKHLDTSKHKSQSGVNTLLTDLSPKSPLEEKLFNCKKCNKQYKSRVGFWKHQKKCNPINITFEKKEVKEKENFTNEDLVEIFLKENSDFKQIICDIVKNITNNMSTNISNINNNSNNTITNSNTNNFNLQVFLNETCKDAINMKDFIDSFKITMSDLEETGRVGFVNGMSKMCNTNLDELDTHIRPIHCSDLKREVFYIKENNIWYKESNCRETLINMVKQIAIKNIKQISEWIKLHPDCTQSDSRFNDKYLHILMNSMSGSTKEEQDENINKVISKLAKNVTIQK